MSNLLETWAPRVYRFARRLCHDPHLAEDLTQETLLRAWRQREQLRDERAARVWLFRIAVNIWRDRLRRDRSPISRAGLLDGTEMDRSVPAERRLADREDLAQTLAALDALPPRQREALYLSAVEGLSSREIADVLAMSPESAKANVSLARKRLRTELQHLFAIQTPVE